MTQSRTAALEQQAEEPEKLRVLLAEDRHDDCLPCRIIGGSAFIGLGAYSYLSGRYQLRQREKEILRSNSRFGMRSRRFGISTIAATLVGVGVWRLLN